jgi:D-alanyl-lipoteichoic acid acyltransferase DltB (MBOAT superfamily)
VFFPALSAGPIDRVQHFQAELAAEFRLNAEAMMAAGTRLAQGLFMKFVLADSLAFIALNPVNAAQTESSGWMWALLLAYTLRIFFDFAGYTHIAIGIGLLFGVRLPENFDQPYLKRNLTQFWNSWHITLAQWFRAYFFNPVTRWLRARRWPVWTIILLGQLGTMGLIGLWHGVTVNFLVWGLWHGAGLFVHNRWMERRKSKITEGPKGRGAVAGELIAWVGTFAYVALGWVWFVLPEPGAALRVLRVLFGGKG